MASSRTKITEIVTGLAMMGFPSVDRALAVRPDWFHNVTDDEYDLLADERAQGDFESDFDTAWHHGERFLASADGLRGRVPDRVEWQGPGKPPGYDQIPADLRVDHVFLVSCKYGSDILYNASPAHVFDRLLAEKRGDRTDWFLEVAPEAYHDLYRRSVAAAGLDDMPETVAQLDGETRQRLKDALPTRGAWPDELAAPYRDFVNAVSVATAHRWKDNLADRSDQELMLWRLLRFQPAPYFVLGQSSDGTPLRFRVGTPSDFRRNYAIRAFDVWADAMGQPMVRWRAELRGARKPIEGHVEVRWSRGRFGGVPEAKVILDTPHHDVANYHPIA
ncbi:MAG: hypothetical protein HKN94_06300 [Acidimicrobiales bacterium]|nr:hypothetical protein [Acidimicrobiales bacterium]RZV46635.1 MAG: hypothetical protein EX269_06840 [Acidimicrobiales bacterium]